MRRRIRIRILRDPPQQIVISNLTNVKKFHGLPEEDVDDWIDHHQTAVEANGWDNAKAIGRIRLSLEGTAKFWYKDTFRAAPPEDLDQFYGALRRDFGRVKPDLFNRQRLTTRRQHMGESPVTYAYDKLELCAKTNANMTEEEKISHIIQGLEPSYSQPVYHKRFNSAASLVSALKAKYEAKLHAGPEAEIFIANMESFAERKQRRTERQLKGLCYRCGGAGHYLRACPLNKGTHARKENQANAGTDPEATANQGNGTTGGPARQ